MIDTFLILIILHFLADFLFQPRWIGESKSTNFKHLIYHIFIYTSIIWVFAPVIGNYFGFQEFADGMNVKMFWFIFIGHFIVDIWTSKLTKYLYLRSLRDEDIKIFKWKIINPWMGFFWTTIGFDQMLHTIHLYLMYVLFLM